MHTHTCLREFENSRAKPRAVEGIVSVSVEENSLAPNSRCGAAICAPQAAKLKLPLSVADGGLPQLASAECVGS